MGDKVVINVDAATTLLAILTTDEISSIIKSGRLDEYKPRVEDAIDRLRGAIRYRR